MTQRCNVCGEIIVEIEDAEAIHNEYGFEVLVCPACQGIGYDDYFDDMEELDDLEFLQDMNYNVDDFNFEEEK